MRLRARLDRVVKQMGAGRAQPRTVVLVEASPERPPNRSERTNTAGLPVVEIVFDPAGSVDLPTVLYKLVRGADPVDWV
jgi:hypothetical protein